MLCPICEGQKVVKIVVDDREEHTTCLTCSGTGSVSQEKYDSMMDLFDSLETIRDKHER